MRHFETETTIDAPPDAVWAVLADTRGWADWDSGVIEVEGEARQGERIKIRSELNPKKAYPVKVVELDAPRRMAWKGGAPLGLFTGVRSYTLSPEGEGRTRFQMREEFTGPLLPLIWRSMPDMNGSFRQFASGLKQRAEAGSAAGAPG
jgi:hypothetical protein